MLREHKGPTRTPCKRHESDTNVLPDETESLHTCPVVARHHVLRMAATHVQRKDSCIHTTPVSSIITRARRMHRPPVGNGLMATDR